MKRRRWDSKTKTKIVLEGLSGRPVSVILYVSIVNGGRELPPRENFLGFVNTATVNVKILGRTVHLDIDLQLHRLSYPVIKIRHMKVYFILLISRI